MTPIYEHRQFGTVTVGAIASALIIVGFTIGNGGALDGGATAIFAVVGVILVLTMILFGSLTVTVDRETVEVRFGPGPVRKRIQTGRIVSATPVRNSWWFGWGIRLIPGGWMFSVSGFDAVELLLGDGRKFRIGTDEPEALAAAINGARKHR